MFLVTLNRNYLKMSLLLKVIVFVIFCTIFLLLTFGPNKNEKSIDDNSRTVLKFFDSKRYEKVKQNDVQAADSCVKTWLKVAN